MKDWDQYFIEMAYQVATRSKDPDSKIGAVIVTPDHQLLTTGYNGLPRGLDDEIPERLKRPLKYQWIEHAERNAIYNAGRIGTQLMGGIIYVPAAPCMDCARGLQGVGIIEVVTHKLWEDRAESLWSKDWKESITLARELFFECGINLRSYDGPVDNVIVSSLRGEDILREETV
jgi:dCMP deaminase